MLPTTCFPYVTKKDSKDWTGLTFAQTNRQVTKACPLSDAYEAIDQTKPWQEESKGLRAVVFALKNVLGIHFNAQK